MTSAHVKRGPGRPRMSEEERRLREEFREKKRANRGRGRPALTEEEKAEREQKKVERLNRLTLDCAEVRTRHLTWFEIQHLVRLYRGHGFDRNHFKMLAALGEFKTYEDHTRMAPSTGRPVEKFYWPEVKAYLDRNLIERPNRRTA